MGAKNARKKKDAASRRGARIRRIGLTGISEISGSRSGMTPEL